MIYKTWLDEYKCVFAYHRASETGLALKGLDGDPFILTDIDNIETLVHLANLNYFVEAMQYETERYETER